MLWKKKSTIKWMWWYLYAKRLWGDDMLVFVYSMSWYLQSEYLLMFIITTLICKYQKHTGIFYVYVCMYILCQYKIIWKGHPNVDWPFTLSDLCCHTWKVLSAFVFQWWIKNANMCGCLFFIYVLMNYYSLLISLESCYLIHCVTFFSFPKLFPFFYPPNKYPDFLTICSSIFLLHWIFQDTEMPTWNPEPQAQLNKEPNSWVLL